MSEREPTAGDRDGNGDADQGGGGSSEPDSEPIITPTSLGDFEIREGEYGPLERRGANDAD